MRNQTIATTLITWTTSAIITWYRLGQWFPTGGPGTPVVHIQIFGGP